MGICLVLAAHSPIGIERLLKFLTKDLINIQFGCGYPAEVTFNTARPYPSAVPSPVPAMAPKIPTP
jgi:hypothetical protein